METNTLSPQTVAPIMVTAAAIRELKTLLYEHEVDENGGIRVGVSGGGCNGLSYILGFDKKGEADEEFTIDGLRFFMNKAHGLYLVGMQVNYQNDLNNRGFTFSNPNASSSCGCGSSFAI